MIGNNPCLSTTIKLLDKTETSVSKTLEYVDKTFENFNTHFEANIHNKTKNTTRTFEALKKETKTILLEINKTLMQNLENINKKSMKEKRT